MTLKSQAAKAAVAAAHARRTAGRFTVRCQSQIADRPREGNLPGELTEKNIFLDGTPLLNADGSENFPVVWEYRPGTWRKPIFRDAGGGE